LKLFTNQQSFVLNAGFQKRKACQQIRASFFTNVKDVKRYISLKLVIVAYFVPMVMFLAHPSRKTNLAVIKSIQMKEFIRPLHKTIYGRIQSANLSDTENEIRKYILNHYISSGKAPEVSHLSVYFNLSEYEILLVLEKLKKFDIINFRDNQIICSYPFSNKETDFLVEIKNYANVFALCATDAVGIHFLSKQNCLIKTKCPSCNQDIRIQLNDGEIMHHEPEHIREFVSLPENCGCASSDFCPIIRFFCSEKHLSNWKEKQKYNFKGEIYELDEVAYHSKKIFSELLNLQ